MRMKLLFVLIAGGSFALSADNHSGTLRVQEDIPVTEIRTRFARAARNEEECRELLKTLDGSAGKEEPLIRGYRGCLTMMMARYALNPASKLDYFKEGRAMLESAIAEVPAHIELRYLRFTVQTNLPSFLGYDQNRKAD